MNTDVDLVIFDCDGVLVDTERIAVRVNVTLGARYGWPLSEVDAVEHFMGRSAAEISELITTRVGADNAAAWARDFIAAHRREVDAGLEAVEGVVEALDVLDAIGVPTCVASSGTHEKMRHTLGRTGLYERFAGRIFSAVDVARGKPAPDLFLHAAASMGVPPDACVVVEDSRYGVQAARAAGMRCLGYAGGLTQAHRLEGPGTVVFHDMRKIPTLLDLLRIGDG